MRPLSWKWIRRGAVAVLVIALVLPHATAAYQYRAAVRDLERYHPQSARKRLDACLKAWPNSVSTRILASRASRESGEFEDAVAQLQAARRASDEPNDGIAFEWALLQAAGGNVREVEAYLQKQADSRPAESHLVWEALAEGYLRTYRILDAMSCLKYWLEGSPDNVRALELRGRTFVMGKGIQRGAIDFRRVLELDPSRDDARLRLTRALLNLGAYDEAAPHLERLAKSRPDDPDVRVGLARCWFMLNRQDEAWTVLDGVAADHPGHGLALRTMGQFRLMEKKPAEAESHLRAAAAALPDDYYAHWLLYDSLRQQGKSDAPEVLKAAEAVRDRSERISELQSRRIAEQPLEPSLHVEMATLLLRAGRTEDGLSWLNSALLLDPKFRPAHHLFAEHYTKIGDAAKAAEHRALSEE
jgi:predicted Zn-dependent protease